MGNRLTYVYLISDHFMKMIYVCLNLYLQMWSDMGTANNHDWNTPNMLRGNG